MQAQYLHCNSSLSESVSGRLSRAHVSISVDRLKVTLTEFGLHNDDHHCIFSLSQSVSRRLTRAQLSISAYRLRMLRNTKHEASGPRCEDIYIDLHCNFSLSKSVNQSVVLYCRLVVVVVLFSRSFTSIETLKCWNPFSLNVISKEDGRTISSSIPFLNLEIQTQIQISASTFETSHGNKWNGAVGESRRGDIDHSSWTKKPHSQTKRESPPTLHLYSGEYNMAQARPVPWTLTLTLTLTLALTLILMPLPNAGIRLSAFKPQPCPQGAKVLRLGFPR